uniref:Uncharacterized protein n=1 Tax=Oryza nivara TaxID=4536 RepID=A0A0E0IEJ6_ORYNI
MKKISKTRWVLASVFHLVLDEIGDEIHHTWLGGDAEGWGGRSGDEDSDGTASEAGNASRWRA